MRKLFAIVPFVALGACTAGGAVNDEGYIKELSESVTSLAAPYQNLNAVRVLPDDGCYWYLHEGPVESTLLPLRTPEGRPICTQASLELVKNDDA